MRSFIITSFLALLLVIKSQISGIQIYEAIKNIRSRYVPTATVASSTRINGGSVITKDSYDLQDITKDSLDEDKHHSTTTAFTPPITTGNINNNNQENISENSNRRLSQNLKSPTITSTKGQIKEVDENTNSKEQKRRLDGADSISALFTTPISDWSLEQFALFIVLLGLCLLLCTCFMGGGRRCGGCSCCDLLACWCCYEMCCDEPAPGYNLC